MKPTSHTILLYGATGYSGRLIAAEADRLKMNGSADGPGYRLVLGGRDSRKVAELARTHNMEVRVFGVTDRREVVRGLNGIDVLINAAGPFALTANHLAKGALAAGCHYVDINGEVDVYQTTDDLGRSATQRDLALVSSAGHTAAASDLLLHAALQHLRTPVGASATNGISLELGTIRIAMSRIVTLSRGSLETVLRSLREQVTVVRSGDIRRANGRRERQQMLWHEPVGKLERTFDFADPARDDGHTQRGHPTSRLRIASAANLVDTLTARLTGERNGFFVHRIESYVEAGTISRLAYQFAPLLTPVAAMPLVRDLARLQLNALPVGPTARERSTETHLVVLEIEDPVQRQLIHWGWHTPNAYDFTARVVLEIAKQVVADDSLVGWLTPSDVLRPAKEQLTDVASKDGFLRGCMLYERRTDVLETAS